MDYDWGLMKPPWNLGYKWIIIAQGIETVNSFSCPHINDVCKRSLWRCPVLILPSGVIKQNPQCLTDKQNWSDVHSTCTCPVILTHSVCLHTSRFRERPAAVSTLWQFLDAWIHTLNMSIMTLEGAINVVFNVVSSDERTIHMTTHLSDLHF